MPLIQKIMDDLICFKEGVIAGLIAPSTLHGKHAGITYLNGPGGITRLQKEDEESLFKALIRSGALASGTASEVAELQEALRNPATSRTVSYLLCNAQTCADVICDLEKIRTASIVIAGCGGIGSAVALLLAGSGVKNLRLLDHDVIEKSNLNRQLFWTRADIGKPKVTTLERVLRDRFDDLIIHTEQVEVTISELVDHCSRGVDVLAVTADNPGTLANDARAVCRACSIPVISGGYLHDAMLLFTFIPDSLECLVAESPAGVEWARLPSCIMPSYGPMNFSLASQISSKIISSIAHRSLKKPESSIARWTMESVSMSNITGQST